MRRAPACTSATPTATAARWPITKSVQNLGPHVAALGMRFYDGAMFPAEYRGDVIVAQHGSWNRSRKSGYQLVRVHIENGKAVRSEPFVHGWLQGQSASGRPVDVLVMPDGSMLVSDDLNGAIYRISYAAD